MSKKKAQDLFYGNNYQKFNALKQQLQGQNLLLLKERQKIEGKTVGYTTLPSQTTIIDKNDLSFEEGQQEQNFQFTQQEKIQKITPIYGKNKLIQSINQHGQFLSDDILEIIDQIQNKALLQIQSLRKDKILLLQRLNKQMKSHNIQKIKRIGYQKNNQFLTQQLNKSNVKSKEQSYKNITNTIYEEQNQNSPSNHNNDQKSRRIQQNQYNIHNMNVFPNQQHYQSISQNQPVLIHKKIQQQRIPSYFPNAHRTTITNNLNPQNNYHPGQNTQIANKYQQKDMETYFNRLKNQNLSLKNILSRQHSQTIQPVNKNSLINQLKGLQNRANYYQRLILKAKGNLNTSQRFEGGQMEKFLLQGHRLAQDGEKLIKAKSNPQFKRLITPHNPNQSYINARKNFTQMQLNTKIKKKQQTPKNYSNLSKNYRTNNHINYGSYENIIQNMQKAVYS